MQRGHGARGQGGGQRVGKKRAKQRQARAAGEFAQRGQRLVANAPARRGGGAHEGRVVVFVDPQAQPGAQVLDFGAVKKALPARNLVRDLRAAQGLLKGLGLVVGAVEHGKVAPAALRRGGAQGLDARHGPLGFVLFVVAGQHAHRLAFAQAGIQALGKQLGIGADHVVGRAQDGAGGAVVLLQLDDFELRKVARQLAQVVQRGAAPAVNALVVIAHGGEVGRLAHQRLHQLVLRGVGVLVFIDQRVRQARLPLLRHFGLREQQAQRQADQIVKVHTLVGGQALVVAGHDLRGLALDFALGLRGGFFGREARVFPAADGPLPLAGRGAVGGFAAVFEQAQRVVAVQNAEARLQAQRRAVFAQQAHAQRVKGADDDLACLLARQLAGALAHLGGGLVGEGDGRNAAGRHACLHQPRNLVGDDARLARTGPGQHQARAAQMVHGILLGEVQAIGGHGAKQAKKRAIIGRRPRRRCRCLAAGVLMEPKGPQVLVEWARGAIKSRAMTDFAGRARCRLALLRLSACSLPACALHALWL